MIFNLSAGFRRAPRRPDVEESAHWYILGESCFLRVVCINESDRSQIESSRRTAVIILIETRVSTDFNPLPCPGILDGRPLARRGRLEGAA